MQRSLWHKVNNQVQLKYFWALFKLFLSLYSLHHICFFPWYIHHTCLMPIDQYSLKVLNWITEVICLEHDFFKRFQSFIIFAVWDYWTNFSTSNSELRLQLLPLSGMHTVDTCGFRRSNNQLHSRWEWLAMPWMGNTD